MKVKIGPHKDYMGPHRLAEKICFWIDYNHFSDEDDPKPIEILFNFFDKNMWLVKTVNWLNGYYLPRKVKIHIDEYDVWGMDQTLSLIVHPMLVKLKEVKYGSACIDDEDVPEHLRSTNVPPVDTYTGMVDDLYHARWDWVLDEMIWAHWSVINEEEHNWYDPLPPDVPLRKTCFVDNADGSRIYEIGNELGIFNKEKHDAFYARQKNGLRLFGKYYRGLWD